MHVILMRWAKRLALRWLWRRLQRWEAEMWSDNIGGYSTLRGDQINTGPAIGPAPDAINPAHYKKPGAVEVVDVIRQQLGDAGFVAYCRGNALKYLGRAGAKPGQPAAQDFAKAAWFARMAAHALEPDRYADPRA